MMRVDTHNNPKTTMKRNDIFHPHKKRDYTYMSPVGSNRNGEGEEEEDALGSLRSDRENHHPAASGALHYPSLTQDGEGRDRSSFLSSPMSSYPESELPCEATSLLGCPEAALSPPLLRTAAAPFLRNGRRLSAERHHPRRTNDEIHSTIDLCPVMSALMDTPPMQRLRGLKQLGTAEYVFMNVNHNRFEHSVGVACLAEKMCRRIQQRQPSLECTDKDVLCVKLAGLMHDIGHGPFSHIFESFLDKLPGYLKKHPELQARYQAAELPKLPKDYRHEMSSLEMIDACLEHLGLKVDLQRLGEPLQELGGAQGFQADTMRAFSHASTTTRTLERQAKRIRSAYSPEDDDYDDRADILTSRDFVFIKECIWGGPIPAIEKELGRGYVGRPHQKDEWMYQIVSNGRSGLDVDKIDYYARDERRAIKASGEIDKVMIEEAVVAWGRCTDPKRCYRCLQQQQEVVTSVSDESSGEGKRDPAQKEHQGMHLMICYPEKMVKSTMNFFKKRFELHSMIYRHKTTEAAAIMICDILFRADPFFWISTAPVEGFHAYAARPKEEAASLPISRAMLNTHSYLRMRDSIIDLIANSTDPNLKPARELIGRLQARDFYKCADKHELRMADVLDQTIWKKEEEEIVREMLQVRGKYREGELAEEDIVIEKCSIHYGLKDKNPLSRMRFLRKNKMAQLFQPYDRLPEADEYDETRYEAQLPRSFQQNSIRLYCRDSNKTELASHVFQAWLSEMEGEVETTPDVAFAVEYNEPEGIGHQPPLLSQESFEGEGEDLEEEEDPSEDSRQEFSAAPSDHRQVAGTYHITPPRDKKRNFGFTHGK